APIEETAPPTPSAPIDQALPGELAEGPERAFGLAIPRRMRVTAHFPDEVHAIGDVPPEALSSYIHERIVAGRVEGGAAKVVLLESHVKSGVDAGGPGTAVRVEVTVQGNHTELLVRDETRVPPSDNLTPDERLKRHGLTPDGKLLDPTHLE